MGNLISKDPEKELSGQNTERKVDSSSSFPVIISHSSPRSYDNTLLKQKILNYYKEEKLDKEKLSTLMKKFDRKHLLDHLSQVKLSETNNLTIKFIVSRGEVSFKEVVGAILLSIFQKNYGPVHTAIQIGPFVLHWLNNGLVKIDTFKVSNAILSLDVTKIIINRGIPLKDDPTISSILDLVVDYNMTKHCHLISCNCQHFVNDVLRVIGINNLEKHFDSMENQQDFQWEKEFTEKLSNQDLQIFKKLNRSKMFAQIIKSEPDVLFISHEDVDKFTKRIIQHIEIDEGRAETINIWESIQRIMEIFQEKCPTQYTILKSFDRSFWLRQENDVEKIDNHEDWKKENLPLRDNNGLCLCPFESPYITGTIPPDVTPLLSHPFTSSVGKELVNDQPVKALVLCGAGLRGATILAMLETIEKDTGKKIPELFNVIAGVSLSGVAAIAISQHISLAKINEFYKQLLENSTM